MQVFDVMTKASVTHQPTETLKDAATQMWTQQTGSLLVMNGSRLAGIVTERDVMKAVARGLDPDGTPITEVMSTGVLTVTPATPLHEAARTMAARWIRHLPVVDGTQVVGMVSQRDLIGIFAALTSDPDVSELASDELVRSRRLVRIEQGDLD